VLQKIRKSDKKNLNQIRFFAYLKETKTLSRFCFQLPASNTRNRKRPFGPFLGSLLSQTPCYGPVSSFVLDS